MKRYRENIEHDPEVSSALQRVFKAQADLKDAALALQAQGQPRFSKWDECFDREAYMSLLEEPRRALQQANEHLDKVSVRACQKAGC